ncbi:MAG: YggT family protein [Armatimonadetes bacterium]|nr:YggT family protein [Armatimonadota bacterium]
MTGSLIALLILALDVYKWILLVRVLMSWIPNVPRYNPIVRFLVDVTDPVLYPFQRLIPPEKTGFLDLSPILAFFAIGFIQRLLQMLMAPGL